MVLILISYENPFQYRVYSTYDLITNLFQTSSSPGRMCGIICQYISSSFSGTTAEQI